MKKSIQIIATALFMLFGNSAFSQNDSLYAMKNGVIIHSFSIDSNHIDSIIFYRPNTSITDADGNVYTSVKIGTQEWMVENLRTTKYSDGTTIPNVTDGDEWGNLNTGAWCHYDNDNQYDTIYGKLYNFYAVEIGELCPTGWHVPTDTEWTVLTDYLSANGHSGTEGAALKATSGWNANGNGTDDYGWNGLPGGWRSISGNFGYVGDVGSWWSSSESSSSNAWDRNLSDHGDDVGRNPDTNEEGGSVRCVKD